MNKNRPASGHSWRYLSCSTKFLKRNAECKLIILVNDNLIAWFFNQYVSGIELWKHSNSMAISSSAQNLYLFICIDRSNSIERCCKSQIDCTNSALSDKATRLSFVLSFPFFSTYPGFQKGVSKILKANCNGIRFHCFWKYILSRFRCWRSQTKASQQLQRNLRLEFAKSNRCI